MTFNTHDHKQLSWRDPDGYVVKVGGELLRAISLAKAEQTRLLLAAPWMLKLIDEGAIPRTTEVAVPASIPRAEEWFWVRHETLDFPCYPHEITALQLYDSALLTLEVTIEAAQHGWTLKDASAWNVLYSRGRPVFIDFSSFAIEPPTGTWMAYGQFVRHFLLPLLLFKKRAITPPQIFLSDRDGVTPERAFELLGASQLISWTAVELVVLPRLLSRAGARKIATDSERALPVRDPKLATSILLSTLRRLKNVLKRLQPDQSKTRSVWKDYEEDRSHYTDEDLIVKTDFVRQHLKGSERVLDLGCNAGEFSLIAAETGCSVVAADFDHPALSRLYSRVRPHQLHVTPVMVNIARPTPAIGWRNSEVESFLDRAAGRFDCVLMLGLMHHLLVSERATLPMIAALLNKLASNQVILEWVGPQDIRFRQVAGLNAALYGDLTEDSLERCLEQDFRCAQKLSLPCSTRVMYLWVRKD